MNYDASLVPWNENGDREVTFLARRRTLWQWLLQKPPSKHVFVQAIYGATVWHVKGTGERAPTGWEAQCCRLSEVFRQEGFNRGK